jgi:DNA-binding transcriptional LysR family regulator
VNARSIEWSDLEIFLAAARLGTLAAAAVTLRVDASTVHRRLGKLEAAMRAALFVRSPRGFALTEAGQDLYAHALAMEEQATAALRKVGARDEQAVGTVRVSTVESLATTVLPPIFATFRDKHPRVILHVDVTQGIVDLAKREADVAIRFGVSPAEGDVVVRRVVVAEVGLFATRAYLKEHGRPKTPEDLHDHLLVRAAEGHTRLAMDRLLERYGDPAKVAFRSPSFYVRIGAIRAGIGIGYMPLFITAGDKSLERLHLAFPETPKGIDLLLVVHADLRKNARVRAFVDHAFAELTARRSLFEEGVIRALDR